MTNRALFISFEGGDGAGKTTLIERLLIHLSKEGFDVFKTRAPGGTEIGQQIRHTLLSKHKAVMDQRCELLLYLADRSQHVEEVIYPALEKGQIVLCDRFNDSTVAYQGYGRDFGEEKVRELCHFACRGLEPDLTFYLDLDPTIGLSRLSGAKDRLESEKLEFHQKIREGYLSIAKREPSRFYVLDASNPPETVFHQALHVLAAHR